MARILLKANGENERRILEHLEANASDALAEKINYCGKTLGQAVTYCKNQARDLGVKDGCVMVDQDTVFGWVIHYFEDVAQAQPKEAEPKPAKDKSARKAAAKQVEPEPQPDPDQEAEEESETEPKPASDPEPEAATEAPASAEGGLFGDVKLF